jgi:hypothetical protein
MSSDTEETYSINYILNFNLELKQFYFNNLVVDTDLNIPIFLNVSYVLFKKYNLGVCYLLNKDNIYYYIRSTLKIPDASILEDLL